MKIHQKDEHFEILIQAQEFYNLGKHEEVVRIINNLDTSKLSAELYRLRGKAKMELITGNSKISTESVYDALSDNDSAYALERGDDALNFLKQIRILSSDKQFDELYKLIEHSDERLHCQEMYYIRAEARFLENQLNGKFNKEVLEKIISDYDAAVALAYNEESLLDKTNRLWFMLEVSINPHDKIQTSLSFKEGQVFYEESYNNDKRDVPWAILNEIKKTVDELICINASSNHQLIVAGTYNLFCMDSKTLNAEQRKKTLEIAYQYINDCNNIYDSEEALWTLISIEHALGHIDRALTLVDVAYSLYKETEYLEIKTDLLIESKSFLDALLIIDELISIKEPDYLEEHIENYHSDKYNLYDKKLQIFLGMMNYSAYAELLSCLLFRGIYVDLAKRVAILLKLNQYEPVLTHLNSRNHKSSILLWFNYWSFVGIEDYESARAQLCNLRFSALFKEILPPSKKSYSPRYNHQIEEEKRLVDLFSVAQFSNLDDIDFWFFLAFLYNNDFDIDTYGRYLTKQGLGNKSRTQLRQELLYSMPFEKSQKKRGYNLIRLMIQQCLYIDVIEENNRKVQQAQMEERNRIMSNLSHSIKNMLKSVIDPLELIKREIPEKAKIIDSALRGTNLIREIVNAINLSYKTTLEDLVYDIAHPDKEQMSVEEMLVNSLKYSISNMFDSKYFPAFMQNYYPNKSAYQKANEAWQSVSATESIETVLEFAKQYMFDLNVDIAQAMQYSIGNEKSSAIKLMILFQEIIFNAVKYCSYIPRNKRNVEIDFIEDDSKLCFRVINTFKPEVQAKTTGVGKLVIENFAKVLGCEPVIDATNGLYSITMKFDNLWRSHE